MLKGGDSSTPKKLEINKTGKAKINITVFKIRRLKASRKPSSQWCKE